ncbi:unnamed protein product [Acanthoscelides obtectus]|uniref:Uncharacterized protein n=1 Tax=Acanthoscelides obtectus TaxID=200917 RepID=A0A9P0VPE4_ACAOB|nr:unnamed protein product [Acanthoscelides obtectus]CAK1686888.1 hypothetical protein AOBTE_LOCUS36129 [Acanthoscelides obtectus]
MAQRDGQRSSGFFVCTPVLQAKRRRMRQKVDIEIETRMPAAVEELRRWTSDEALGDVTVMPDCASRIPPVTTFISDNQDATDVGSGVVSSDDEGVDHKLPSPEEQLQVMALNASGGGRHKRPQFRPDVRATALVDARRSRQTAGRWRHRRQRRGHEEEEGAQTEEQTEEHAGGHGSEGDR